LRDTAAAGKTSDKDPVLLQAEEILKAAIIELETLGLPQTNQEKEKIRELLQDELTGKNFKELDALIQSEDKEKTEKITKILDELDKEKLTSIILKLLTD